MYKIGKARKTSEILPVKGRGTEWVSNIKYLVTVMSNTNDETEEVKARIVAANKAYSSANCI
jgi:hypothetical protein